MAQSKLRNQITIKIYENTGKIEFKNPPTGFELMTAKIVLEETIDFYFNGPEKAKLALQVYDRIEGLPLNMALSAISVLIDELAKIHDINTMEMWDKMRKAADDVYQEMGGVDYEL